MEKLFKIACGIVCLVIPSIEITGYFIKIFIKGILEKEMHRHHGVAAMGIRQCRDIIAISFTKMLIPLKTHPFASLLRKFHTILIKNRQMQCHHTVTTVNRFITFGIFVTLCINIIIPGVLVTSRIIFMDMDGIKQSQVQCIHLSAAVAIRMFISFNASGGV